MPAGYSSNLICFLQAHLLPFLLHSTPQCPVNALPPMLCSGLPHTFMESQLNIIIHSAPKTVLPPMWKQSLFPLLLPIIWHLSLTYHRMTLICLFTCLHVFRLHTVRSLGAEIMSSQLIEFPVPHTLSHIALVNNKFLILINDLIIIIGALEFWLSGSLILGQVAVIKMQWFCKNHLIQNYSISPAFPIARITGSINNFILGSN